MVGQRPEEHAIDDGEDGRIGADAQSEAEDYRDGKAALAAKEAEGVREHGVARKYE
jgi:hypothetical protein